MDSLISVIVPVYNVEQYLPRCVDSILAQTYENLEILLVDDGSRDSSGALCDDYARRDKRIRVIHKENGGLSSARNAGIDVAHGEYLAFIDSDDYLEPDAYALLLELAQAENVLLVCGGRYDVSSATGARTLGLCPVRRERISAQEFLGRIFLWDHCDSVVADKLFHASLFRQVRFPVGMICEDVAVMYRIILPLEAVALLDRPVYNYFHRPGSITTAAVSEKTFHFSQHTAQIYPYIREHCPQLEPQARYFRVRSLAYNLLSLENAPAQVQARFADVRDESRRALAAHTGFVLTSPYFAAQERLTDLLLIAGLYRFLRPVYHRLRHKRSGATG